MVAFINFIGTMWDIARSFRVGRHYYHTPIYLSAILIWNQIGYLFAR